MYGILNDGIRVATVTFSPKKLDHLQRKYGDSFRALGGSVPLQPAAVGTATVEPLWKKEPVKPASKPDKPKKEAKATKRKLVPIEKKTGGGHNAKPVVSITTGEYYPSCMAVASAIGAHAPDVAAHLNGTLKNGKYKRGNCKGQTFRYATPEEIAAQKMLPTPKPKS